MGSVFLSQNSRGRRYRRWKGLGSCDVLQCGGVQGKFRRPRAVNSGLCQEKWAVEWESGSGRRGRGGGGGKKSGRHWVLSPQSWTKGGLLNSACRPRQCLAHRRHRKFMEVDSRASPRPWSSCLRVRIGFKSMPEDHQKIPDLCLATTPSLSQKKRGLVATHLCLLSYRQSGLSPFLFLFLPYSKPLFRNNFHERRYRRVPFLLSNRSSSLSPPTRDTRAFCVFPSVTKTVSSSPSRVVLCSTATRVTICTICTHLHPQLGDHVSLLQEGLSQR